MKIDTIKPEGIISDCPLCRYKDGFHVSFHVRDNADQAEIVLICPNCHNHFQLGWRVGLSENHSSSSKGGKNGHN